VKQAIAIFSHVCHTFQSKRLLALVTVKGTDDGIFPDIDKAVGEFEAVIKWK
jgi:hypothetical protein